MFVLSQASKRNLVGVHPDLVKVVERAIERTPVDFRVTEGVRTPERQAKLKALGASRTLNSRHLTGHAVDVVALIDFDNDGDIDVRWDWPLYEKIARAMKAAASELDVPLVWGGDWTRLRDGPHFELPWKHYPA